MYRNGQRYDYTGKRKQANIVKWVTRKSGLPSVYADCDTIKKVKEDNDFSIVYFGDDKTETEDLFNKVHLLAGDADELVSFYHTNDTECASEFGVKVPAEVVFRNIEEPHQLTYTGALDNEVFRLWYKPLMVPHLFKFTEDQIDLIFENHLKASVLFRTQEDEDSTFTRVYEEASNALKGKVMFTYSDMSEDI